MKNMRLNDHKAIWSSSLWEKPSAFGAVAFLLLSVPALAFAAPGPYLRSVYARRADLRALFDPRTYLVRSTATVPSVSLEDWARQDGWREDPKLLFYKPKTVIPTPVKGAADSAPATQAEGYVVLDRTSGLMLAEQNAGVPRPLASLTKLMTVDVVLSRGVSPWRVQSISRDDIVGGSSLGVKPGTRLTVNDLLYAALLPSANDAANALADATRLSRPAFVGAMNARARAFGLPRTVFADPTGLDEGNVSTPRELAALADRVFAFYAVKRDATTPQRTLTLLPRRVPLTVKNSDFLLTKPAYSDVYVTAGKTGYLGPPNGWNLAVSLRPSVAAKGRELLVVMFGEPMLADASADAHALAQWAWGHYAWK